MKILGQAYDPLIPLVVGTQTAATNAFTGVLPLDELVDGQSIRYWLPYAGTSSGDTLNLTLRDGSTTGAIQVYYRGTTKLTTHFSYGTIIMLTYRENAVVNGTTVTRGWWATSNYNTNTTNSCGSANTSSKIFLVGRTTQSSTGGTSYSHDTAYVGTDGCLYSGSKIVATQEYVDDAVGSVDGGGITSTVLYNNTSGTTGTVTLSESAANFTMLEIIVGFSDTGACNSLKVYSPNGKTVDIWGGTVSTSTWGGSRVRYAISGTTVTASYNYKVICSSSGKLTYDSNNLYCKQVIGYR